MKKFNKFGFASAIVLAGAMGFAACSSDDEEFVELNPTFDGNSVKTQFAISLTKKANKGGRMTEDQVQANDGDFQGMNNIHLYHFNNPVADGSVPVGGTTDFKAIAANGGLQYGTLNAKIYNNVDIATGVSHFLFYGQTAESNITGGAYTTADFTKAMTSVNNITFTPKSVLQDGFNDAQTKHIAKWNTIYAKFDNITNLPTSIKGYKAVISKMANGGSASSNSMKELLQDIYFDIKVQYEGMPAADPNDPNDPTTATKTLMDFILTTAELEVSDNGTTLEWTSTAADLFPNAYGLPEGALELKLENSGEIAVNTNATTGLITAADKYVYPASLFYYANTAAGVRNETYFDSTPTNEIETDWTTLQTSNKYTKAAVSAITRSVILWDQVQYGVARLETTVKFDDVESVVDGVIETTTDKKVSTATAFPVTGVLVGGQKQVGWDFTPTTATEQYVVWDSIMTKTMSAGKNKATGTNHTLVYETGTEPVNIAVELVNASGADFYGHGGKVVPAGATFYLVAKLDPTAGTGAAIDQVFKQDYVTKANLTITSLANAYNVIPNLEQSKLEFGMSVNLEWQEGLTFNVDVK